MQKRIEIRLLTGIVSVIGLILVFVFQRVDLARDLGIATNKLDAFLINRSIRFFLNDLLAIGLIYALFPKKKYVVFAIWVQIAGLLLFLIPYFILKINFPRYNGPLINFLHRLILNPTLLLLLIPAFYYQNRKSSG